MENEQKRSAVEVIGEQIAETLAHHACQHTRDDAMGDALPLVDMLTPLGEKDITLGKEELVLLADALVVAIEPTIIALSGEVERMREALEHYGNEKNWHVLPIRKDMGADNQIKRFFNNGDPVDGFKVAQEALGRNS